MAHDITRVSPEAQAASLPCVKQACHPRTPATLEPSTVAQPAPPHVAEHTLDAAQPFHFDSGSVPVPVRHAQASSLRDSRRFTRDGVPGPLFSEICEECGDVLADLLAWLFCVALYVIVALAWLEV